MWNNTVATAAAHGTTPAMNRQAGGSPLATGPNMRTSNTTSAKQRDGNMTPV